MANSRKKNRRRKVLSTVLLLLAILIAGAALGVRFLRQRVTEAYGAKSTDEVKTVAVTRGSISTTITGSGTLSAIVTKIDPEGENSGGNTKYSVTLALTRTSNLYPGMNGTVCFPRSQGRQVPTVPLAALVEEGNRTLVYTAYDPETDQLLSPVEVKTGLSDGTDVQILAGLSLGDAYFYRYADAISYVTE